MKKVEYIDENGEIETVRVGEDVFLTAGTIGTPAILLRSGVGPCSELTALGINCVIDRYLLSLHNNNNNNDQMI